MANNWFPHDSSASTDQKILQIRSEFGNVGYAWFLITLEWLWQLEETRSDFKDIDSLSFYLHEDRSIIERFINRCIEIELFIKDSKNRFYSFRLCEEKKVFIEKSKNAKRAVEAREAKRRLIDESSKLDSGIERSSNDISNDHPLPNLTLPKDHIIVDGVDDSPSSENRVERVILGFEKITGTKVIARNEKRKSSIKRALKTFTDGQIISAWESMKKDPWLNRQNPGRKLYLTIDYALRIENIEKYIPHQLK